MECNRSNCSHRFRSDHRLLPLLASFGPSLVSALLISTSVATCLLPLLHHLLQCKELVEHSRIPFIQLPYAPSPLLSDFETRHFFTLWNATVMEAVKSSKEGSVENAEEALQLRHPQSYSSYFLSNACPSICCPILMQNANMQSRLNDWGRKAILIIQPTSHIRIWLSSFLSFVTILSSSVYANCVRTDVWNAIAPTVVK